MTDPAPTRTTRGIAHMPALDGIRALAVLAVMAYHSGLSFLPAGFFGVDAFFVLSGFLITTLLVTEWAATGGIGLRAFWARRARRLLPALLVMLVFVVLYARFVAAPGTYPGLRWDSIAALFYSANWRFIANGTSYFAQTSAVSPLLHTWSLAIEEQFYIVWPLVVLGIMRMQRNTARALQALLLGSVVGALASAIEMALVFNAGGDPTRAYFGTDTHAQCLLVGAALAAGVALWRRREKPSALSAGRRRLLSGAGLVGAGMCAWAWSQMNYGQTLVFRGGFLLVSVSVAVVIASSVLHPEGVVVRVLSWTPLQFLGRISYGMYLWHFPLDIVLSGSRTGLQGVPLFLFRTVVTVVVSTVSFYGVEKPIRSGTILSVARARVVTPTAVIAVAVVVFLSTVSPVAASGTGPLSSATPGSFPESSGLTIPASLTNAPVRVAIVGDSEAFTLARSLRTSVSHWNIAEVSLAIFGCGIDQGSNIWDEVQGRLEESVVPGPCRLVPTDGFVPWTTAWPEWFRAVRPNVVVLLAGRREVDDRTHKGRRTNILQKSFAAYTKQQLERAVQIGTSTGARMVIMTSPCLSLGDQLDGAPWPQNDIRRIQAYNRLVKAVGAEFPAKVAVQDLYSMTCPNGKYLSTLNGLPLREADGVHFSMSPGGGAALLAPRILPLWEQLGHEQEAAGGKIMTGPPPTRLPPA